MCRPHTCSAATALYLFILSSYSVLCWHSSALSSVTRPWRALERQAWSQAGLPGSLGSLLLIQVPASSKPWPTPGDLWPMLLLGKREGSVCRELQGDESLARQAVQLLTEPWADTSQEEVPDHAVLATLGVLGKRLLGRGTLS